MSAATLQASPPWSVAHEEDRRFRWILAQTLVVSLVIGAVTPYIPIPQAITSAEPEPPPRRVHLLAEQPRPAPTPLPLIPAPVETAPPTPPDTAVQKPVTPEVTPRQKAARSGVLALGDELRELRDSVPKAGSRAGREYSTTEVYKDSDQPSLLTSDVTRGSGGIEGGIAHQSVLGTAKLPEREGSTQTGGSLDRGEAGTEQARSAPPGVVRSQEEIQELLDRNKGAMYTLYNRELHKDASLQGKLVMSITIAPAGNVTRCVILSSELDSDSLEQQLIALVTGIDFGNKPGGTVVTTRIPIEFFPR
jgi:hypothetical protein